MLILGKPGSGKSTLMKYVALMAAQRIVPYSQFTPIFIPLHEWSRLDNWNAMDIKHTLRNSSLAGGNELRFFDKDREKSKILFLFDGLDEIADEELRRKVIVWFQKLDFGRNPVIITSRNKGFNNAKNLCFKSGFMDNFAVADLNDNQIKDFCRSWFEIFETHATEERRTELSLEVANKSSESMISDLFENNNASIQVLARIPMLLSMIAMVYKLENRLPRDRHELYGRIIDLMAESPRFKFGTTAYPINKVLRHLSVLARGMTEADTRTLSLEEAYNFLPEDIENHKALFFLEQMIERIGLLYRSDGRIGFIHLSFQEYLSTYHFMKQDSQPLSILQHHKKSSWYETRCLVFQSGADNIKTQILQKVAENIHTEYHQRMNQWEDCLKEIRDEGEREKHEIDFGQALLNSMLNINDDDVAIWNVSLYF